MSLARRAAQYEWAQVLINLESSPPLSPRAEFSLLLMVARDLSCLVNITGSWSGRLTLYCQTNDWPKARTGRQKSRGGQAVRTPMSLLTSELLTYTDGTRWVILLVLFMKCGSFSRFIRQTFSLAKHSQVNNYIALLITVYFSINM